MVMRTQRATIVVLALMLATPIAAHPGGLDKNGCHNDRKNGGYHCHGSASTPSAAPPPAPTPRSTAPRAQSLITPTASTVDSSREITLSAQLLLSSLGYAVDISGVEDPKTRRAIGAFFDSRGFGNKLRVVSPELVLELARAISQKKCR